MRPVLLLFAMAASMVQAQTPTITKIDPPNWYATLPKPMLLIRGEQLTGASFRISDKALTVERTSVSENGHYAQIWLSASPARPETVQIEVRTPSGQAVAAYRFAPRRAQTDGMAGFAPSDVMYLILTDRFADGDRNNDGPDAHSAEDSPEAAAERAKPRGWHGGDLRGIARHLEYLERLGVTTVWPTPVYQNHGPEAYHGYHATDYYAVDEHYGTLRDLQDLARDLHRRGMKLVLDTVPNHVGPFHPWVDDEPTPDWFHGTKAQHVAGKTNFDALIDPHATAASRVPTLEGWFVDLLPDMNTENPAVATYLRQNAVWWIEQTGADGLRIDTFPYVDRAFWHEFTAELHTLYPRLTEVGEVSNGDPEVTSAFAEGVTRAGVDTGLYTPFDFPFFHATRDIFAHGAPFTRFAHVLVSDELYPHPERLVPFLGNHDESRFAEAVPDPGLQQVAYTLLLTTRGTPQLYAGDEIGMTGGNDPDNRRDFPGGFGTPARDAFTRAGRTREQGQAFTWLQQLLALRRKHAALAEGAEQVLFADRDLLIYVRSTADGAERVLVALNKGTEPHTHGLSTEGTVLSGIRQSHSLLGDPAAASLDGQTLSVQLAPESVAIIAVN